MEGRTHRQRCIYALETHVVSTAAQFHNHEVGIRVRIFDHQNAKGGAHKSTCHLVAGSFQSTTKIQLASPARNNLAAPKHSVVSAWTKTAAAR